MNYTGYDMNAYNLHVIKTDKFKTVTVGIAFRRRIVKEEITMRNLLKEVMINSSYDYPTEKDLIIETENLYDLKLSSMNYRVGNYAILSFKIRFLNEKYTEKGMNEESIKFLLDLIFKPNLGNDLEKCKNRLRKSIELLGDNKIKYTLFKLLSTTGDMPYAYNSYGYIDDLDKIHENEINNYYYEMIKNDLVDVYVVGDVCASDIKNIFREYFKLKTFHKQNTSLVVDELPNLRTVKKVYEKGQVNQSQLTILCNIKGLTDYERKYVLPLYGEMLGGSANSILFDSVREKNSYAYYVNTLVKSYDNIMMIYSGIEKGNEDNVLKLIKKGLKNINKGDFSKEKFLSAKETLISAIQVNMDNPMGIISNYYAKVLVNSLDSEERIKMLEGVSEEDIINVSKKVSIHTIYILEGDDEKDNNK